MNKLNENNNNETMVSFIPELYVGVWHEIASIPKPYELGCDSVFAIYSLDKEILNITNICLNKGKIVDHIKGYGVNQTYHRNNEAKFYITFNEGDIQFNGTYWIYSTDYATFSIVGNEEGDSLWILSRNQIVDNDYKMRMLNYCEGFSLNTDELEWRY